ncbi:MAG: GDP-mannose 4,6-dehydratase, partial [Planctomycetia bacterium]
MVEEDARRGGDPVGLAVLRDLPEGGGLGDAVGASRPQHGVLAGRLVAAACRIARGEQETLALGDLSVRRDWGWAPEYVEAMHRMLQLDSLEDFVIATGITTSLEEFVAEAFRAVGLDWRRHVVRDATLMRPSEILAGHADTSRASTIIRATSGIWDRAVQPSTDVAR